MSIQKEGITLSAKPYDNLIISIFSAEVTKYKLNELDNLMSKLLEHFPCQTLSDGHRKPIKMDNEITQRWFSAYNHLLLLIESRKQNYRYNTSLWVSSFAIVISIISLLTK